MQLQQALAKANQAQAAKSKAQRQIEQIMQQNDLILERNFLQNMTILKKEELKQQGFHFNFTTCCSSNESSDLVHCLYNFGFSIKEDQVFIYRMNTR